MAACLACFPVALTFAPTPSILKAALLTHGGRSFIQGTFSLIQMWCLKKAVLGLKGTFLLFKANNKIFSSQYFPEISDVARIFD